jgi:hypothetical protein
MEDKEINKICFLLLFLFFAGGCLVRILQSFLFVMYELNQNGEIIGIRPPDSEELFIVTVISFILWIIVDLITRHEYRGISFKQKLLATLGYFYMIYRFQYTQDYSQSWFLFTVITFVLFNILKYMWEILKNVVKKETKKNQNQK